MGLSVGKSIKLPGEILLTLSFHMNLGHDLEKLEKNFIEFINSPFK